MIQIIIQIEEIKPDLLAIDVGKNSDIKGIPSPREIQMALWINNRLVAPMMCTLKEKIIRSMIEGERKKST